MKLWPNPGRAAVWDERCSEILRRMAGRHHDREISASIEAETGKHFNSRTVAEYRRANDLPACRRNGWTRRLKVRKHLTHGK